MSARTRKEPATDVEERLDRIFAAAPEDFTEARNELAKDLKRAGESTEADRVRKLRRPTRPAWVVNRIALEHPARLETLLDAVRRLRGASDGDELRAAAAAEREAILDLSELAREELGEGGGSSAALDRVVETLQAVAADEGVERQVVAGRLEREQRVASVGGLADALAASVPEPKKAKKAKTAKTAKKAPKPQPDKRELDQARKRVRALRSRARTAASRQDKTAARAERAKQAAAEASEAAAQAASDRAELEAELADAEAELERLRG